MLPLNVPFAEARQQPFTPPGTEPSKCSRMNRPELALSLRISGDPDVTFLIGTTSLAHTRERRESHPVSLLSRRTPHVNARDVPTLIVRIIVVHGSEQHFIRGVRR